MYAGFCIVMAAMSLIVIAVASKGVKQMAVRNTPFLLHDDRSSGRGLEDDEGDDDIEGSTDTKESDCERVRNKIKSHKMVGAYVPQCTPEGEFNPFQCTDDGKCFCVDVTGQEIPGTWILSPDRPNCSAIDREEFLRAVTRRMVWPALPTTMTSSIRITRKQEPTLGTEGKLERPLKGAKATEQDQGTSSQVRKLTSPSNDGWVYIKSRPTLLASIICGTVVGILCAMLLILFVVYRFRKKDEGSYALDEPKNSPAVAYTKAHDREFFA